MTKTPKKKSPFPMPFNEALKSVWAAKPVHRVTKKQEKKKPAK